MGGEPAAWRPRLQCRLHESGSEHCPLRQHPGPGAGAPPQIIRLRTRVQSYKVGYRASFIWVYPRPDVTLHDKVCKELGNQAQEIAVVTLIMSSSCATELRDVELCHSLVGMSSAQQGRPKMLGSRIATCRVQMSRTYYSNKARLLWKVQHGGLNLATSSAQTTLFHFLFAWASISCHAWSCVTASWA